MDVVDDHSDVRVRPGAKVRHGACDGRTRIFARLTSASVSPWVATTLPSLTPTITPHPVPQKRHGAFDHLISSDPMPPATGCAAAGAAMPATAAAIAAACVFNNSRRDSLLLP